MVPVKSDEDGATIRIGITRIHMEEDAGKLLHDSLGQAEDKSLVDFNRAGVPLIEIVSEPDLRTPEQAGEYLKRWRQLLRYLGICDGNLEEGSMRCDANVSVRPVGDSKLYTKVEIKNINSFRFVQQAIQYEIDRQIECVKSGEKIVQETRLWDSGRNMTRSMRSKEEAQDYRYFPEPDLIPLKISTDQIDKIKLALPELPYDKFQRFQTEYQLSSYDVNFLTQEQETADYFEIAAKSVAGRPGAGKLFKDLVNWMMGDFTKALKDHNQTFVTTKVKASQLLELVLSIASNQISGKIGKAVFEKMFSSGEGAGKIIQELGVQQISDSGALQGIIAQIIAAHPKEVAEYKSGRDKLFGFFVGQVMKASKGQANPGMVNQLLKDSLSKA
jgi:aspartyl-tRNA(Asn)/glutamyl-tRNA(Gln) amidotransferase subunit B